MRAAMVEVSVALRTEKTKGTVKRLRKAGKVPAVVYGRELEENLSVTVEENVFHRAVPPSAWYTTPLKLSVQDPAFKDFTPTVMLAEVKQDILTGRVISADFHVVSAGEKVHARIPVSLTGESPGVKKGGVLEHLMHEVHVESLVTDIPTEIEVDISDMDIGERFRVEDLPEMSGVVFLDPLEEVVVLIAAPRVAEEVEAGPGATVVAEVEEPESEHGGKE